MTMTKKQRAEDIKKRVNACLDEIPKGWPLTGTAIKEDLGIFCTTFEVQEVLRARGYVQKQSLIWIHPEEYSKITTEDGLELLEEKEAK